MLGLRRAAAWLALGFYASLGASAHAQEVIGDKPAPPPAKAPASPPGAKPPVVPPSAPKPAAAGKPAVPAPGTAKPEASVPPTATPPGLPSPPQARPPAAKPATKPAPAKPGKKGKGRPPKRPSAVLPAGASAPEPNDAARRRIAAAPLPGGEKKDPELEALRAADKVLFPKPLPGSTSGFSWDLPKPAPKAGARVLSSGLPPSVDDDPGLDDSTEVASDSEWIRSLSMPDLPVRLESRVVRYLKFYRDNPKGKAIARVWAKKSGRYVTALKAELTRAGLPADLVWLSLIESGHNPTIVSPAGAGGLWQFMPEAGRLYGLQVDRWVDERFDPKRATDAAVLYLGDLYRRFGSWELAMAAYNMGYAGLSKAIRKFNTNDYWKLCLYEAGIPWETTLYVPKIFALAVVMNNKKAFGLADVSLDAAESFDGVMAKAGLPLERVAEAARIPLATLEADNPQFLLGRIPPGKASSFRVRMPADKAQLASAQLAKLGDPEPELEPYAVRLGDTPSSIAELRSTERAALARVNRLKDDELLSAGTWLLVPKRASSAPRPASSGDVVVVSPREFRYPDRERVFYRVQSGDTLGKIAQAFAVSESELEAWNTLDSGARLVSGMTLALWVGKTADLGNVRALREKDVRVLVAGTPEFFDYFEGQNGKKRITVEARAGDTLQTLGRRYGMSVGWMERINRRSRKKKLEVGDKLVVYVASGSAPAKAASPAAGSIDAPAASDSDAPVEPAASDGQTDSEPVQGG